MSWSVCLRQVTTQDTRRAVNEQFGGEDENATPGLNMQPYKFTKHSNAYMLVYVRASDWDDIMCEVSSPAFGISSCLVLPPTLLSRRACSCS